MWYSESYAKCVSFDIWVRGSTVRSLYRCTAARPGGEMPEPLPHNPFDLNPRKYRRLVRLDFRPERQAKPGTPASLLWETVAIGPMIESGPFYVATNASDRFFVTKPAASLRAAEGQSRHAVEGDLGGQAARGRPDPRLGQFKWYAFTKDEYFQIADPIRPLPISSTSAGR